MVVYFADRIKTKYTTQGIEAAKTYYNQIFSFPIYQPYKADTDAILIADRYGDVISDVA
ncbi:hypothetical protein [Desulfitobacterium sp. PCE1]|uniref:hypothetical protein n=1 Tax=Desulfitobacterium sp. PCE1 TaxID=146907 RepID=UPI00037203F2|nr:hypothetical protein [Desulfitobacterium sp. PCE1]